jgi:hypothetical protein
MVVGDCPDSEVVRPNASRGYMYWPPLTE